MSNAAPVGVVAWMGRTTAARQGLTHPFSPAALASYHAPRSPPRAVPWSGHPMKGTGQMCDGSDEGLEAQRMDGI